MLVLGRTQIGWQILFLARDVAKSRDKLYLCKRHVILCCLWKSHSSTSHNDQNDSSNKPLMYCKALEMLVFVICSFYVHIVHTVHVLPIQFEPNL
jgi:hypothetical protein